MALVSDTVGIIVFVADLERATEFYEQVLGLTVRVDLTHTDPAANRIVAVDPAATLRYRILTVGDNPLGIVCLMQISDPAAPGIVRNGTGTHEGESCVAFYAPALEPIVERLEARGHPLLSPPTLLNNPDGRAFREILFRDPDGALINIMEETARRG